MRPGAAAVKQPGFPATAWGGVGQPWQDELRDRADIRMISPACRNPPAVLEAFQARHQPIFAAGDFIGHACHVNRQDVQALVGMAEGIVTTTEPKTTPVTPSTHRNRPTTG